jgi:SpoVK/Ycf46/Vps4 family AAA+-type ATPase
MSDSVVKTGEPTGPPAPAASQLPAWASDLSARYLAGAASVFLLHGNIHDYVMLPDGAASVGGDSWVSLEDFLATQLFGRRDIVIQYDRGSGIRFLDPRDPERRRAMREDFERTLAAVDMIAGSSLAGALRTQDPRQILEILDRYLLHKALQRSEEAQGTVAAPSTVEGEAGRGGSAGGTNGRSRRKSVAVVLRYAELLAPTAEIAWLSGELGTNLVKLLNWANDPAIRGADITICLLCENLAELNRRLIENPFVGKIEVTLPDRDTRRRFVERVMPPARRDEVDPELLASEANGLTLVGVSQVVRRALGDGGRFDLKYLKRAKKELIEKECFGLIDFIEPRFTLDLLVAERAVKDRLADDARLIREGRFGALPMGYLLCGMLGTGKTFAATCFAGSIGIPAVVFKNLREKWVGSSEGNMQKVLSVVKALGPVVVIVDEADAALGKRSNDGDSGTSGRLFAMIAAQMADTEYRGRIIWLLLTCRPELLPVDLKRQGRCEVHIPLFPPQTEDERRDMFRVMAKKSGIAIDVTALPPIPAGLSGADIESVVVQSMRIAALRGVVAPDAAMVAEAINRFVSPNYSLEKELQELVAIRESTDLAFLPERLRPSISDPEQNARLERRIQELQILVRG